MQFKQGDEIAMSNYLIDLWLSLNGSQNVYLKWGGGDIDGVLFHSGLYDTAPLQTTLRSDLIYGINRNVTLGSTNLNEGYYFTFNESVGEAIIDATLCSSAFPFFLETHQFEGYTWSDGFCVSSLDTYSPIVRCLDVTTEENIILDIVYCIFYDQLPVETKFKTPDVFARAFLIRGHDGAIWYTYNAMIAYPKVNFRYIVHPSEPMSSGGPVPLNFTYSNLLSEVNLGIKDTTALFNEEKSGREIIQEHYQSLKSSIVYPEPEIE